MKNMLGNVKLNATNNKGQAQCNK